jgi:hypothetical protein
MSVRITHYKTKEEQDEAQREAARNKTYAERYAYLIALIKINRKIAAAKEKSKLLGSEMNDQLK